MHCGEFDMARLVVGARGFGKLTLIPVARKRIAIALTAALVLSCAGHRGPAQDWYRDRDWNSGTERYSAWFGDERGGVLYFGLSPFWTLWWASGGDPRLDLDAPGDHLIGRFDLRSRRFLEPLRARSAAEGARSSVWDVLAHSSGRIYYTTFYEELGWIASDGSDAKRFPHLGFGFNELAEGPGGRVYATRYADAPERESRPSHSAVTVIDPEGALIWETRFERAPDGSFVAPKSIAVDPTSGEVWVNTDTFSADGSLLRHETLRLSADGELLDRDAGPAELQFAAFSPAGEGWFAQAYDGWIWLRWRAPGREERALRLVPLEGADFVQDIKPASSGGAVIALWSRRAFAVRATGNGLVARALRFRVPPDCEPPDNRSLLYTAVEFHGEIFATLFCGPTVVRAALAEGLAQAPAKARTTSWPTRSR